MKKNITILCNAEDFKKRVAKKLSDELDMLYADFQQILEYNLIDSNMIEKVGQQYYDKSEESTLRNISDYSDTIITLDFSTLNKNNNIEILKKNTLIIYLSCDYNTFESLNNSENDKNIAKINSLVYHERDLVMRGYSDIIVNIVKTDISFVVQQIMQAIEQYFNK